ncbi:dynein axonemal assembly factor 5-like [Macrobrachium nipponense]|uniref:dynein axonemal assembly factor 5-like n=1 Tax=Macrobrachium nipponense TaxID=159736 RepID=UPI0030C82F37
MATEDTTTAMMEELNEIFNKMNDDNKAKRRKALEKYSEVVFESEIIKDERKLTDILTHSIASLVPRLSDQSEMNRINASNIILKFINLSVFDEKLLIDIIPVIYHRLGSAVPPIEESEEVRLLYINIVAELVTLFQGKLIPYMNDVINILKASVLDPSPEVRKAATECTSAFAKATREKFHMQSESLVKPLTKGLNHQRFKNRIACINALGDILLFGDGKVIKDVSGPMAQCAMDLPQVRLVLVTVGGTLAKEMPDRYSYWHYILPLFLFGLTDEDNDVREKAMTLWSEVGKQYEMENEDQLKEEMDFGMETSHYPSGESRPGVGCRTLVYRSIHHILPGLLGDLDDWQAGPRLQAARLLTTLVLNAEKKITQYAERIMVALHLAAGDKEENIVKQVLLCSEYLGHFLPPATYLKLVLPRICAAEKGERPLKILAALLRGSPDDLVDVEVTTICQTISSDDVAHVYDSDHQEALVDLITVIIQKCDVQENSYGLFCTLLFIASSSEYPDIVKNAQEQLAALALKCNMNCVENLYQQQLKAVLIYFQSSAESWLEHTPCFQMFIGLLEFGDMALGSEVELLIKVLCTCVPTKQDALVSLRCLTKMQQLLVREDCPLQSQNQLGKHLPKFVLECIAVFLPWHAGMTAASLRTAAVACFVAVCKVRGIEEQLNNEVKHCLTLMPALIEDEAEDTRRLACEAVSFIKSYYPHLIDSDVLHQLADKLVGRLDDIQAIVRLRAANVLTLLFQTLPENYDATLQSARLQDLYERSMIFLDDPDIKLQEAVLGVLYEMGRVSPPLLMGMLENDCHKYRNKQHCLKLIEDMKVLTLQG